MIKHRQLTETAAAAGAAPAAAGADVAGAADAEDGALFAPPCSICNRAPSLATSACLDLSCRPRSNRELK